MTSFKIATWNVNSLRVRLGHVQEWLEREKPDILALQETKSPDEHFPHAELAAAGYHIVASGQKTYNGVAILSRHEATNVLKDIPSLDDPARRILCATIGEVCVLNLYVPNGESLLSEKYQYKLSWLEKVADFIREQLIKTPKMVLVGDFNIAPEDIDVHDPKQWEGHIHVSPAERAAFKKILSLGFHDCVREQFPDSKLYSWWDYRMNGFKRNLGLRIDHILASKALKCVACQIDKTPRALERPSDHTPVIAQFNLDL